MPRKEIDPRIQAAATSYAARFSKGTVVTHFVAFHLDGDVVSARIEYDERRARAWAYQSGGECFAVQPSAGGRGVTIARLKPLTAAQWRAMLLGRR